MSGKLYVKNHLPVILLNLLGALALSLFLLATGNAIQTVLFILITWILVLILCLTICYLSRKKRLSKLLDMAEQLKEKYLIPEVMPEPDRADMNLFVYRGEAKEYHSMTAPAALIDALVVAVSEKLGDEAVQRLSNLHRLKKAYDGNR